MDVILLQSKGDTFLDHQHSIRYPSHDYYKYNHIESGILYKNERIFSANPVFILLFMT